MPPSALLVVLSLLAATATTAVGSYCSSDSYGLISGTTVVHQAKFIQQSTDIPFNNVCPFAGAMQGLFVVACSDVRPPTVQVQSLYSARVYTNMPYYSNVRVQGFTFCSGGALASNSENDVLPLIGGALPVGGMLPLTAGAPAGAGAEALPADHYQLQWN